MTAQAAGTRTCRDTRANSVCFTDIQCHERLNRLPCNAKYAKYGRAPPWRCRSDEQFGLWLSLVERLVRDQEAVGSNPTSPINNSQRGLGEDVAVLVSSTEIK